MKKVFLGFFTLTALYFGYRLGIKSNPVLNRSASLMNDYTNQRLKKQVDNIKAFIAKKSEYNTEIAFFIDMKIKSGENRFFVYHLKENKIVDQGLVAHGSGSEFW